MANDTCMIVVTTRNLDNPDEPAKRKVIDHNKRDDREWLGKHCFWAMRNNHSVCTAPNRD